MNLIKTRKIGTVMSISLILAASCPVFAQEDTDSLERQLATQLQQAQDHHQQLERLSMEMSELQTSKTNLEKQLEKQQSRLTQKRSLLSQRLQALQVSDFVHNAIAQLIQSASVTEFVQRFLTIQDLLHSDSEAISDLQNETKQLQETQNQLTTQESQLMATQESLEMQTKQFNNQISSLKQLIEEHKEALITLKDSQVEKVQEQEAKATTLLKTTEAPTTVASLTTQEETTTSKETPKVTSSPTPLTTDASTKNPITTGRTLTVVATGYSYTQVGLSHYTATGIDLRATSNVIAVDPSVIPLGSIVEIPGYGIAIAGDTGGDIKGNRIDLHYATVDQAMTFGRQELTIRIVE